MISFPLIEEEMDMIDQRHTLCLNGNYYFKENNINI